MTEPKLNPDEMKVLPTVIAVLEKIFEDHPLTAGEICDRVRGQFALKDFRGQFNGQRLRKFVNYIRANSLLPVVSKGQYGYYITRNQDLILKQVESLEGRILKTKLAADGLRKFLTGTQTSF